ncbi:zinc finger protein OZF-like isoform X1 [Cylas formicarius]|uniref:zinc finger protein OZF-like isoform X1 n=2 Tax=Cylas formicarius TaxID=197179 RepID=UPI0029583BEE|nr:zinc finger protein OZF-like isoform X1 [Cylas formicarius]
MDLTIKEEPEDEDSLIDSRNNHFNYNNCEIDTPEISPECVICNSKFVSDQELKIHQMIHSTNHKCFVCGEFVKNRFQFVGHVRKHMVAKPFLCPEQTCNKAFASLRETKLHCRVHSDERPYMCTECGKAFKQVHTLREHEVVHTGIKRFKCKICNGTFGTGASHRRHVRVMHETVRSFQCNYCYSAFTSRQALQQHKTIHRDEDSTKCPFCNETFTDHEKFEEHKKKHVDMKETGTCEYCLNKTFYINLKEHVEKMHKPRTCNLCSLVFFDDKSLNNHQKSHMEIQNKNELVCNLCGKQFDFIRYLKAHVKRHQDDYKKFKCQLCDKAFSSKRDLTDHTMVHSDVKNYKCSICNKAFRTKQSVNKHMPIHSDKRPFECRLCQKTFKKQSILRKHMITHSNIRPFQCQLCSKTFKTRDSLGIHKKYSHTKWKLQCKTCHRRFQYKTSLKTHDCKGVKTRYHQRFCRHCKRRLKRVSTVACHKLGHFSRKLFYCDICKSEFKFKYSLIIHRMKHRAQVPSEILNFDVKDQSIQTDPIDFGELVDCDVEISTAVP